MNVRLMTIMAIVTVGALGLLSAPSVTYAQDKMSAMSADNNIASWPADAKKAAEKEIARYGQPNEVTETTLTWLNNGPWKRTVASRTPITHLFPAKHSDSMEQFVNYEVPFNKFDELARFDGSVNVDRTRGELSARCDTDEHNFLAINLANDIITGKLSVAEARDFYGRAVKMEKEQNKIHPYMTRLMFTPKTQGMTADADKSTIKIVGK